MGPELYKHDSITFQGSGGDDEKDSQVVYSEPSLGTGQ